MKVIKIILKFLKETVLDFVSGILIAVGVYNFAAAALLPLAGLTGITEVIYAYTGLPIGAMTLALNIPIILISWKQIGKNVMLRSIRTTLVIAFCVDFIAPIFPAYTGERLLAALSTGVLHGLGYGLIFCRGTSSAGIDFILMLLHKRMPHLSFGNLSLANDIVTIIVCALFISEGIDSILYGFIASAVLGIVMDKVMFGLSRGKFAIVISERGKEIADAISVRTGRGATLLNGRGSYTGSDKDVLLCACSARQMLGVERSVKETDPAAFVVVVDSSDVIGEGFRQE